MNVMHQVGLVPMSSTSTGNHGTSFRTWRVAARGAEEIVWSVVILGTNGAPTTATVRPRCQILLPSHLANTEEERLSASQDPIWKTLDPAGTYDTGIAMLPDGDWPAAVDAQAVVGAATSPYTNALLLQRRQRGGYWSALQIDLAFTGGTAPTVKLQIMANVRY